MTDARDIILHSLAGKRAAVAAIPDYVLPAWTANDTGSHFIAKARASVAKVHEIRDAEDTPVFIRDLIKATGLSSRLHLPEDSPLRNLPWDRAPELTLSAAPPSGDANAIAAAEYGIAETGTLVFFSGPRSLSSWHFRPGREFVLLPRAAILPRFEDVIALIAAGRAMPATLNLITGPSRTADIEQTIELGAHGPRDVHILVAG